MTVCSLGADAELHLCRSHLRPTTGALAVEHFILVLKLGTFRQKLRLFK